MRSHSILLYGLSLFAVLASTLLVNAYVDPANFWHDVSIRNTKLWGSDECYRMPPDFDERKMKYALVQMIPDVDILFFGSSRALTISQKMMGKKTAFTAGMTSSGIEDFMAIWDAYATRHRMPKEVVFFVDHNMLERSEAIFWTSNASSYLHYANELAHKNERLVNWNKENKTKAFIATAKFKLFQFSDLLSRGVLTRSIKEIIGRAPSRNETGVNSVNDPEISSRGWCWFPDGGLLYGATQRNVSEEELLRENRPERFLKTFQVTPSAEYIEVFRAFVQDLRAKGIKVKLILPPFQTNVVEYYLERADFKEFYSAYRESINKLDADSVCDALDPRRAGCERYEFMDGTHMKPTCVKKLLRFCGITDAL